MKTIARYVWAIAALGGILLISGCTTAHTNPRTVRTRHIAPVNDFAVVESSTDRELSPQEMSQLHDAVVKYLESEGMMGRKGEYFVRVDFTPENSGGQGEWVIVKITNIPSSTYTLIAAYPAIGSDDYYPPDYVYDAGFTYWDMPYGYYDPSGYYPGNNHRRLGPLTPHRPDGNKPGVHQPRDKDNDPRGTHARHDGRPDRNDGTPGRDSRPRNTGYTPRSSDSGGSRDHGSRNYTPPSSGDRSGGSSYSPPPPVPQTPASAPVSYAAPVPDSNPRYQRKQD